MAVSLLFSSTVVGTGTGGSTQTVVVPFSGVTGNNVVAVMLCTARVIGTTFNIAAAFDGNVMTLAAEATGALNGFGEGSASIFYFAAGNLSGASGDATFEITSSNGLVGRIASLAIYSDLDQTTPLRDTDTDVFVSAGTSSTVSMTSVANDLTVDCITLGDQASLTPGGGQTTIGNVTNGTGNGDPTRHGSSSKIATTSSTSMSWSIGNASWAHVGATFIEDAVPGGPIITQVTPSGGAGAVVRPTDVNITVDGADFTPGGTTQLILSPTTGPGDPLAVIQTISSILASSLNWDNVNLGSMQAGPLFLFVRVDAGGPGEEDSPPFPIVVSNPDIHWDRGDHTTDGNTGLQSVVTGLAFKPVAAFVSVTGNTSVDTLQADCALGHCLVSQTTAMGIGLGAQASPNVTKRKQISGTGALFIMDPNSSGAADVVIGTPILSDDGLDINFTTNTSGYHISVVFVGGLTARSELVEVQINDGSVVGLSLAPDLLIGLSSNQTQGQTSDTTFARQSLGVAIGSGTSQFNQSTDMDSGSARNVEILLGTFLAQLNGTSNTWTMVITALTSDGFTWSGSNSDNAYVLAIGLDTAQTFLTQWSPTSTTDGDEEDMPDSGIEDPGILVTTTAHRSSSGPSMAQGAKWASGVCLPGEVQAGSGVFFIPSSGTGDTEQVHSHVNMLSNTNTAGVLTYEVEVIDFKQQPRVIFNSTPGSGRLINMFMAEEISAADDQGGFANVW